MLHKGELRRTWRRRGFRPISFADLLRKGRASGAKAASCIQLYGTAKPCPA